MFAKELSPTQNLSNSLASEGIVKLSSPMMISPFYYEELRPFTDHYSQALLSAYTVLYLNVA